MANELKSALEAQQLKGLTKADPISLPGFGPAQANEGFDPMKYSVHYLKVDLDDLGALSELEAIETRAFRNDGVYVLSKERATFMDRMFIVVSYLERDDQE